LQLLLYGPEIFRTPVKIEFFNEIGSKLPNPAVQH